jgi:Flp pilus assembly protein TadD
MNYKCTIPAALIGVSIALVQTQAARAICSNDQVDTIGKEITVLIDSESPGSGVIIKQTGNTYTVITAYHVVKNSNLKYQIVTPDNQRYQLNYQTVKRLDNNIDLAILQFTSKKDYQVAKIGNSDEVKRLINVHVAGFPRQTGGVRKSIYDCRSGRVIDNLPENIDSGYNLFYDNPTLGGMSGGAVLNDQGEVIAIHGQGEESNDVDIDRINSSVAIVKSGRNSGIPINTFLRLSARNGVDVGVRFPDASKIKRSQTDDYFAQGVEKELQGDNLGAIVAYTEAIRLNPKYAEAYNRRGIVRKELGDKQAAIDDFTQAIKINPNYDKAYNNRGIVRNELGDKQGAIDDFNQAIKINPNDDKAYYNRGIVRNELGDNQGAIDDYTLAIKFNPNLAQAYNNRGFARSALGDKQGAIADFNQAIKINPNNATAYNNRGNVHYELGDKQGAIDDYNLAIKINPNYANAYNNRGNARYDLGDKQAAISDLQQAANLFQEQGNLGAYQMTLENIRKIQ